MKNLIYALFIIVFSSVVLFAQSETLRGDEAIKELKNNGQYDSLINAVKSARKKDGQTEEPQAEEPQSEDAIGQSAKLIASDGAGNDQLGFSVAISGDTAIVGAYRDDVGANINQGSAYIFVRSGVTWTQQAQLIDTGGAAGDQFGYSVAISGDTAVIGAPFDDVGANSNQGSAYIFVRSGTMWSEQQKLTASDGAANDEFGWSVAISSETAIVGGVGDNIGGGTFQGSAYIFVRSGTMWSQQQKLTASDGTADEWFGYSVGISSDTVIVGAYRDTVGANFAQGSAYIFVRSGTMWSQQQKLTASDGAETDTFGCSVAIFGDTAIVGACQDDVGANSDQGSAYIFVRSGTMWSQQQKLTAADGAADDLFGWSVAISGNNIIVGAFSDDVGANGNQGSAYVFRNLSGTWNQEAKKVSSDGAANDQLGWSVAISGDTAIIGAYNDTVGVNAAQGSAYIFVRSGTVWNEQQKLTAADGAAGDVFGWRVGISGDTVIVGAPNDDTVRGSAYIFIRSGTTWSQQQKLTAADGAANDRLGISVAIDGNTVIVGADIDDNGANFDQGLAYIYTRSGITWSQQAKLLASDGAASDQFGWSVAISGNTVIIGAYTDDVGANTNQGSAYIFVRSGTTWSQQQKLTAADGAANDFFGGSVAISGETVIVGAYQDAVGAVTNQGSAYIFVRSVTTWSQQQKLTALDGATDDFFGYSVAISGETLVVGALADDVAANSNQGSAYVYERTGTTWTQVTKLVDSSGAATDQFGTSVGISGDKIVVGAIFSDASTSTPLAPQALDQGAAIFFVNGFAPLAANVSIGGRILTADGNGVRNAIVSATLANGEVITTRSTAFGYYNFEDLEAGQTIVVSVISKRFSFTPQAIMLSDNIDELNFWAQ